MEEESLKTTAKTSDLVTQFPVGPGKVNSDYQFKVTAKNRLCKSVYLIKDLKLVVILKYIT